MLNEIIDTIKKAESNGLLTKTKVKFLLGLSGNKLIGTLQQLAALLPVEKNLCYIEIDVFQGLTLLSVASACPNLPCYGIDNFAYYIV